MLGGVIERGEGETKRGREGEKEREGEEREKGGGCTTNIIKLHQCFFSMDFVYYFLFTLHFICMLIFW